MFDNIQQQDIDDAIRRAHAMRAEAVIYTVRRLWMWITLRS